MSKEAKIISVEIKQEDGINKIFLTCEFSYGHNIQAVLYNPAGDFSIPLPDDFVTLHDVTGTGNYIAIGNLNNIQNVNNGEKKLYSRNSGGTMQASIYLKNDKTIVLNEGTDFAVRYNELKSQLDTLKSDFNDLISRYNILVGFFNGHKHSGVQAGGSDTAAVVGAATTDSPTTVDFSNTKVTKIQLPGVGE